MSLNSIENILSDMRALQVTTNSRLDDVHSRIIKTFDRTDDIFDNIERIEYFVIAILAMITVMIVYVFFSRVIRHNPVIKRSNGDGA